MLAGEDSTSDSAGDGSHEQNWRANVEPLLLVKGSVGVGVLVVAGVVAAVWRVRALLVVEIRRRLVVAHALVPCTAHVCKPRAARVLVSMAHTRSAYSMVDVLIRRCSSDLCEVQVCATFATFAAVHSSGKKQPSASLSFLLCLSNVKRDALEEESYALCPINTEAIRDLKPRKANRGAIYILFPPCRRGDGSQLRLADFLHL